VGAPIVDTVTFLFTDIEGSTRLWREHPATMPDALARHDAIARAAIADGGGQLFKHTGDGVCAAFADAPAALATAVALQRDLAAAAWGDGPQPSVRIAVDSGPAYRRDGDYFGATLNRTARVLAVGSGGQILATTASVGLAPGVETIDLGFHRLRDLGEPIRLYQLAGEGLVRTFPPLRSLERFRHNLPVVRSSFVGREHETARVRELLVRARVLTITGVGGCGKTRLALAVASQELERYADGAFFVDLSIVSDPDLVWSALAGALGGVGGGALTSDLPPRELVLGRLADATALVVLDNCEHLLDASAEVAATLTDRSASVAVLATSREPLGLEGEQVFRVPSLALPVETADAAGSEAVRLFVERATTADATFALTPAMAPTIVEICRRLDGIPLALELAAARVRHLSPAEIARRLDDRFRLLTGGPRGARQRQQTLAAALDWSFQLLAARERVLLRRLAVFVDGFSLEAAEGVCAGEDLARTEVVDVLGALVDKSLVSLHGAERRYRLLETIRLYALDRLVDAGEAPAVRARHLAWFERACATRPHQTTAGALDLASAVDVENLRVAREWAHETGNGTAVARLTVSLFWHGRAYETSMLDEATWCRTALAYGGLAPELHAELLTVASFRDISAGDWDLAIADARSALALTPVPGEGLVSGAYAPLAIALMVTDPDAADREIDDGIEQVRRARAPAFPDEFLASLKVGTALMRGDAASAAERGRRLDAALPTNGMTFGLGFALHLLGDHDGADADAASRPIAVRVTGYGEHSRRLLFALTAASRGRWDDAGRELAAAAAHVRRYRYPLTLNDCVIVCGALAALGGRFERACTLLAAVVDRSFVRSPEMWAVYLHYRGRVRAGLDPETIRRCRQEAQTLDLERALDEELARLGTAAARHPTAPRP
jgi:predicted ATPase/class 3 adenylate cyclase